MYSIIKRTAMMLVAMLMLFTLVSCNEEKEYYAKKENYVYAVGTITFINYTDDAFYFGFSDLSPSFDDNCFKIVGENVRIAVENGIKNSIEIGDTVSFCTAPRYFGDGYVFPIIAMSKDEKTFLDFDEGYENFLQWIQ